jgi:hypothetical protein
VTEKELLVDCLRRLDQVDTSYMPTGSMMSNYRGIPRATHDLDFVVQLPEPGIAQIVTAFSEEDYIDESAVRAAF